MIDLKLVRYPRLVRSSIRLLERMGLGSCFVPGGTGRSISTQPFDGNRLCGDPARYERNARVARRLGSVAIGAPTIGWLSAAYRAMSILQADGLAAAIKLPVLLVGAGDDPVCLTGAAEIFAGRLAGGGHARIVPGARHELLMETDTIRKETWEALDAFLDVQAPVLNGHIHLSAQPRQDSVMEARIAAGDDRAA